MRNFAEEPPSDPVRMLYASRTISEQVRTGYPSPSKATEAATYVRRALAFGNLRRLSRELRDLAANYYPGEVRARARFAILALAIEAIVARRDAERKAALPARRRTARKPRRKGPTKVDNVVRGEMAVCPECGKEFRRDGRAWSIKVHCSKRCKNRAWAKAHPRRVA